MKVFGDFVNKQNHPLHKIYKINYFENQRKVIEKKDNDEYLKSHLMYTRHKNFMKKELTRKTNQRNYFSDRRKEHKLQK